MIQENGELNNPDAWLIIPEFGVAPDEVDFEGFKFSVFGPDENRLLGESLIPLVSSARNLVRAQFSTMAELNAAEEDVLKLVTNDGQPVDDAVLDRVIDDMTSLQSACFLYMTVMSELKYVTWRSKDDQSSLEAPALLAAATLFEWGAHGPREAAKHRRRTNAANAMRDRPKAKSKFREAVMTAMKPHKLDNQAFKSFMQMWERAPLDGLRLSQHEGTENYRITDENGELGAKSYTWGSLGSMYSS